MAETLPVAVIETAHANEKAGFHTAIEELKLSTDPIERTRQLTDNTTAEGLLAAITLLHTALAPDIPHEPSTVARTIKNPRTGEITANLMQPEDRMPFFSHAADLIKKLGETVRVGDEQSYLNRAGNILALATVLSHTFEDGNGRTARTLAHAVRSGSEVNDETRGDFEVVSKNRGDSGFRIISYVPVKESLNLSPSEILDAAASLDIPLSDQTAYQNRAHEHFTVPYDQP